MEEILEFYRKNKEKSNSQHLQDLWVLYETKQKCEGYFIDFGATDGVTINNTLLLEKQYGWKGILAEPNPVYHDDLVKNRTSNISFDCVYTTTGTEIDFLCVDASDISTIDGYGKDDEHSRNRENNRKIKVKTTTLIDLLDRYGAPENIDYLSIDTEGSEYDILKTFFETNTKYNIKCITVEHNWVENFRLNLSFLFQRFGYTRKYEQLSRCDDFYVKG